MYEEFSAHCFESIWSACEPLHPLGDNKDIYLFASKPRGKAVGRVVFDAATEPTGSTTLKAKLQVPIGPGWKCRGKLIATPADLSQIGDVRQWVAALKGDPDALAILEQAKAEGEG